MLASARTQAEPTGLAVNESLPIFLDSVLGGGVGAVVISTCLIVILCAVVASERAISLCLLTLVISCSGEIIPQAVCARYGQ